MKEGGWEKAPGEREEEGNSANHVVRYRVSTETSSPGFGEEKGGEMKVAKITLFALLAALVAVGVSTTSYAFHSGGVAECTGCHSMHSPKAGASFLLIGGDQSSVCLSCHMHAGDTGPSSYHIMTPDSDAPAGVPPKQRTPGGDFGWLRKTYTFTVRGTVNTEDGATHGHNVVAADFGMVADPTNTLSPGGSFSSAQLGCQSCHDPHSAIRRLDTGAYVKGGLVGATYVSSAPIIGSGSTGTIPPAGQAVGVYRLLRGLGDSSQTGATFPSGVAVAVAPSTYNQSEVTNQVRVAYGSSAANSWSDWCATCHIKMHGASGTTHPVDQALGSTYVNNYNAYVKSGDLSGSSTSSFTSLVPFAEGVDTIATLKTHASSTNGYLTGPATTDKVICLSCHRAHASAFPEMLRWNMENEFMTTTAGTTVYQIEARGRTNAEAVASYYDRPPTPTFATFQRVLCNKCHVKD